MLEALQDASVHPEQTDDLHTASASAIAYRGDRRRPGIGNEMLKLPREAGAQHLLRRQQRQDGENDDATPGEGAK
jgi:hypothetical protein